MRHFKTAADWPGPTDPLANAVVPRNALECTQGQAACTVDLWIGLLRPGTPVMP
jgi:hypothetical protein